MIANPNPDRQARMLALPLTDGFTDVALKTHVYEEIFEAIIILGGNCGKLIINEHAHIGIPSGIDLPLLAIYGCHEPFGKLNALLAALRQYMLIFMPTQGGIVGGEDGAMMEIEFFNNLTGGLGRQLYNICCTFANAQKLNKQDFRSKGYALIGLRQGETNMATASFRRPGEAFTSLEKMVERYCTNEMKMVIARLLTGMEAELDTMNTIAHRRPGRDSVVLDRDDRFAASLLLRNTVVTNTSPVNLARAQ